jgi:hypothetical protein
MVAMKTISIEFTGQKEGAPKRKEKEAKGDYNESKDFSDKTST